jgi:hypothetical protein
MALALANEEITFWQVILIIGAVVLVAVIALLSLLLSLVPPSKPAYSKYRTWLRGLPATRPTSRSRSLS